MESCIFFALFSLLAPFLVGAAAGEGVAMYRVRRSGPGAWYGGLSGILGYFGAATVYLFLPLGFRLAFSIAGLPDALDLLIFPCGAWALAAITGMLGRLLVRGTPGCAEELDGGDEANMPKPS